MANWSGFVLTDVGAKLQAKINAGLTTLKFTKLGIGSGSGSGSINALTAMVNKVQDINIGSVKVNNNIVTINSTLTNKGLGSAYQMRELGLFATDPDVGEILFAYMTDNTPDTMPADGSATVVSQDITLNITFSNTGKVSATIDTGAFVTHEDLNTHNTSSSAHADIRRMFNSYLPLTGGTLTGRLYVNDAVFMGTETSQYGNFIERSKAGTMYLASGKSESSNLSWFNVDGYFKYTDTAEMCVIKRDENSNILARAYLLDKDNKTRFPGEVYSNEKLLATKEYVDTKGTNDMNAHNTSSSAHADIRTKITSDINAHNSSGTSHADIRRMFNNYLPLTGGTLTGSLSIDGGNNIVHYIGQGGGTDGGNLNLGDATKTKSTALCCINRPMWWNNNSSRSLALEEDINTHNASSSAHKPILDAIKAITGTSAFNTAPSKKITEIITLLGQGGIVSSKLDAAAGFVKFANGFTIQWGKSDGISTNPGTLIRFPIAFNTIFGVLAMPIYKSSNPYKNTLVLNYVNTTNFKVMSDDVITSCFWTAIGLT